jgi:hypothetical protein
MLLRPHPKGEMDLFVTVAGCISLRGEACAPPKTHLAEDA